MVWLNGWRATWTGVHSLQQQWQQQQRQRRWTWVGVLLKFAAQLVKNKTHQQQKHQQQL
jgi:hypothetical protein